MQYLCKPCIAFRAALTLIQSLGAEENPHEEDARRHLSHGRRNSNEGIGILGTRACLSTEAQALLKDAPGVFLAIELVAFHSISPP